MFFKLFSVSTFLRFLTLPLITNAFQACDVQQAQVICTGDQINDASLLDLHMKIVDRLHGLYFQMLIITDTHMTNIPKNTFGTVLFENIIIENNPYLETIDADAFTEQTSKVLYIINNPLLKNNSIYKLTHRLHVSEAVDFDFNGLEVNYWKQNLIKSNHFSPTGSSILCLQRTLTS